jgi:Hypothetical glycosyl hydrolase family 15
MYKRIVGVSLGVLLAGALAASGPLTGSAAADTAGTVHFVRLADSSFDKFTSSPTSATQEWMNGHMWRMIVWSPYFDEKTRWYSNGWVYDDSYAIYRGSAEARAHPEWILRDSAGRPLYIPSGCSGTSCPEYAGDISNPAFRQAWIEELKSEVAKGYRGVFIDDVNMEMQVGNGNEETVAPIDPSTGRAMTSEAWRGYMARFMQEVRAQLPDIEIAHNAIWYADEHAGTQDPSIRAEIEAANYIFLERGANDSGLTGGEGQWSLHALLGYVDEVHALGRSVVMDGTSGTPQGMAYNLASYFLVSDGSDAVSGDGQTPENWWSGWSVELGEALGPRYTWSGLLRRDFAGGMVLVNQPGEATRTVSLPTPMENAEGVTVSSVTLGPGSGAILKGAPAALGEAGTSAAGEGSPGGAPEGGASAGDSQAGEGSSTSADSPAADFPSTGSPAGGGSSGGDFSANGSSGRGGSGEGSTGSARRTSNGGAGKARTNRRGAEAMLRGRHQRSRTAGAHRARAAHEARLRRAHAASRGRHDGGEHRTRAATH